MQKHKKYTLRIILVIMVILLVSFYAWLIYVGGVQNTIYKPDFCIDAIELLGLFVGAAFALYQWNVSTKRSRASYLLEVMEKIRDNENFSEILYMVEYEKFVYDPDKFHESPEEKKLDSALFQIRTLIYLKNENHLSNDEFEIFEYLVNSILKDENVYAYLENLKDKLENTGKKYPFEELLAYSRKLNNDKPIILRVNSNKCKLLNTNSCPIIASRKDLTEDVQK